MSLMQPKKTKYAKMHKGRIRGFATRGDKVSFGSCGIKSTEIGLITARQIESARRAIVRAIKRGGQVWIRIFPDKPITKKPLEVRQGKGKGSVDHWSAVVKPGTVLFELEGIDLELARHALRLAGYKLPVRTRFVKREVI